MHSSKKTKNKTRNSDTFRRIWIFTKATSGRVFLYISANDQVESFFSPFSPLVPVILISQARLKVTIQMITRGRSLFMQ